MSSASLPRMPDEEHNHQPGWLARWRSIETPAMWFVLMNGLDAAMTYIVLNAPPPEGGHKLRGVEHNEVARFFLDRWGFKGLFAFKLASAVFVCTLALVISFKNVQTARRLLAFGAAILLVVVVYSLFLARFLIHGVNVWPFG